MDKNFAVELLKKMLKEQLYCLGRVAARYRIPEDIIWEVVRGFDVIYMKTLMRAETPVTSGKAKPDDRIVRPHPGIVYLLNKVDKSSR